MTRAQLGWKPYSTREPTQPGALLDQEPYLARDYLARSPIQPGALLG